jgi:hypothetical protein
MYTTGMYKGANGPNYEYALNQTEEHNKGNSEILAAPTNIHMLQDPRSISAQELCDTAMKNGHLSPVQRKNLLEMRYQEFLTVARKM